jgi:Ca2+-binding EF-hand superfamily protein
LRSIPSFSAVLMAATVLSFTFEASHAAPAGLASIAFDRLDIDASGGLDSFELRAIGERRMARLDRNRDGAVTREEFATNRKDANAQAVPAIEFDAIDRNSDGAIAKEELVTAEAERVLALADGDANGLVSREEFMALAATLAMTQ